MTIKTATNQVSLALLQAKLSQARINAARSVGSERLKWLLIQAAAEAAIKKNYGKIAVQEA